MLLHQFIHWIEINPAVKVDGIYQQRINIFFNCVGEVQVTEQLNSVVPIKEVSLDTRKGVRLSYSLSESLTA